MTLKEDASVAKVDEPLPVTQADREAAQNRLRINARYTARDYPGGEIGFQRDCRLASQATDAKAEEGRVCNFYLGDCLRCGKRADRFNQLELCSKFPRTPAKAEERLVQQIAKLVYAEYPGCRTSQLQRPILIADYERARSYSIPETTVAVRLARKIVEAFRERS